MNFSFIRNSLVFATSDVWVHGAPLPPLKPLVEASDSLLTLGCVVGLV